MALKFILVYFFVDAFCLAFSLVIYSKISIDMGTEREVHALRRMIASFAVFLVADSVWAMCTYDAWLATDAVAGVIEFFTMLAMGFVAYFWFIYAENRLQAPYANHRAFAMIAAAPIVVAVFLLATTYFTGLLFTVGPDGSFTSGPLSLLPIIAFLFYVLYTALHALVRSLQERSSTRRREHLTFVWFAIPPLACGVFDIFVHGMPVMAISVFSSVLLVFMTSQDLRINIDALTGLNNRRRAVEYMEDLLPEISDDGLFAVFMIDVDYFKEINDTHGHGMGDRALQLIAEALRHAMGGRQGLVARWGGDEFLVAMHLDDSLQAGDFERVVQSEVDALCERSGVGFSISVSVGFALAHRGEAIASLVAAADGELYKRKAAHHAARGR